MFYLTLPSNSSEEYFPNNTLTHYFTKLPQAVNLTGGQWEMGLVEIQYPHTWYNIPKEEAWFVVEIDGVVHHFVLQEGFYDSPELLIKRMRLICKFIVENCESVVFTYDHITQKVTVSIKPNAAVSFSPPLQIMLGFAETGYEGGIHESD